MRRTSAILLIASAAVSLESCIKDDPCCEPPFRDGGQIGCYVSGYSQVSGFGNIGSSFGNPYYDSRMAEEVAIQRAFFTNVPARVFVLYERNAEQRNAYATPDGYILFGYYMFYFTIANYTELAAAGVLAHEWGHRVQFAANWSTRNPFMELEADAFSGYYMALQKQWAWSQIQGYFANVYAQGDYNFNHPTHHGTPHQRIAAAYLGVNTAIQAMINNRPYSYTELHEIFIQGIGATTSASENRLPHHDNVVKPQPNSITQSVLDEIVRISNGETFGKEVLYPRLLSDQDISRLKPLFHSENPR